ncbi:growth-regulating factor 9-like [Triticum dicoccoides]|uniref:Growth-regulating factor n=2 Tax=Triticum TaxID=4564 RepID=A0A9R0SVE0_TRITD|nr:growth-regulating factor 9-like [Triticum dicoccoides]XP_044367893.1 growth-regulating factor 9-like [Triticum aestivum]AOG30104.1 growth regulating factor 9-B1 [Triticum aestivum]VAI00951.1 unnamed protein product [Triticum turgidum subsp. durum]
MELGQVLGFAPPATKDARSGGGFAQAAAAPCPYPSPFLDEQKMLSFSKAAAPPSSGMDFGRSNEQRLLLARSKMPFTPSQWMELEHQALIYKYLNAKAPIPSGLLISISKSFRPSSDRMPWRPVYQGFTNADSDPEPGRCRRTDGKKWRCSKEAMAEHKYCERHINRNRHRSRKPVENQTRKNAKETPDAGSLSAAVSHGGCNKKAKAGDELKPGSVSYWTDNLNRAMVSKARGSNPEDGNSAPLLNSTNQQHTLSLFSQLKQQSKPDKFSPAVDSESISSNTVLKPWERSNQQSSKDVSSTTLHDRGCLQSVLQDFSMHKNESQKINASVPSTFYSSTEGRHISCLASNMMQVQEDCISSSWEIPQGGPLGEILTNSKNTDDLTNKCESRSYGWLLSLDEHEM